MKPRTPATEAARDMLRACPGLTDNEVMHALATLGVTITRSGVYYARHTLDAPVPRVGRPRGKACPQCGALPCYARPDRADAEARAEAGRLTVHMRDPASG